MDAAFARQGHAREACAGPNSIIHFRDATLGLVSGSHFTGAPLSAYPQWFFSAGPGSVLRIASTKRALSIFSHRSSREFAVIMRYEGSLALIEERISLRLSALRRG